MMDMMAKEFPDAFAGYNLEVTESHQRTKADTSGTAKAVVGSLQKLGLDFSEVSQQADILVSPADLNCVCACTSELSWRLVAGTSCRVKC